MSDEEIWGTWVPHYRTILLTPRFVETAVSNQIRVLFHEIWHSVLGHHSSNNMKPSKITRLEEIVEKKALEDLREYKYYVANNYGLSEEPTITPDSRVSTSKYQEWGLSVSK